MLSINFSGKRALIAGIGDDKGFGWAIAKALAEAGAEIIAGTWPPLFNIFKMGLEQGKFDADRTLSNGNLLQFSSIIPLDAAYDTMSEVPEDVRTHRRYKDFSDYAIKEAMEQLEKRYGRIDIVVHSLANGPEVQKPLLETSRHGYLAAISASTYSFISLLRYAEPLMPEGSAALCLSYIAAERVINGYGGGMSSAKAALESDVCYLAAELGRKKGIRVNAISAGPYASRAATAIGPFIHKMIDYYIEQAPLARPLQGNDIGRTAAFLCSSELAGAITGVTLPVDCGYHVLGAPWSFRDCEK